jgi:methoxymalonate biosynthesis acyl carrier protein
MHASENAPVISAFLLRHVRKDQIRPDEDIFAAGYVNSLFALQLITFIEKTFSIRVDDEDLELANFRSITAIDAFVARKRNKAR